MTSHRRLLALLVAAAALAALLPALATAAAGARHYDTTVEATDSTDFSLRAGDKGNRCSAWSRIEGTVQTTITPPVGGKLVLYPSGKGVLLTHSLLVSSVRSKLRTTGTEHPAFPCGCGPNSELGPCPPARPDEKVDGTCRRAQQSGGMLGLRLVRGRFTGIVSARPSEVLDSCPLAVPELLPDDIDLPKELPLPAAELRAIRALQPGESTRIHETMQHRGKERGCVRAQGMGLPESVCGVLAFTMEIRRTK